ncbi:hypothetical protein Y032_0010g1082 [Ancylostoma ceylanicum]|uniref:Uncharacterized protein n=1 Tax=Ancylostoma ceylanicum TaxID=53326 RepID=A0A016VGZ7_9BILA|nr:hypothetical protein Y032_0010g1082 [Ancylostoma ceylanicum]
MTRTCALLTRLPWVISGMHTSPGLRRSGAHIQEARPHRLVDSLSVRKLPSHHTARRLRSVILDISKILQKSQFFGSEFVQI